MTMAIHLGQVLRGWPPICPCLPPVVVRGSGRRSSGCAELTCIVASGRTVPPDRRSQLPLSVLFTADASDFPNNRKNQHPAKRERQPDPGILKKHGDCHGSKPTKARGGGPSGDLENSSAQSPGHSQ